MWMAEGLILSDGTSKPLEDIREEYFQELMWMSFFEDAGDSVMAAQVDTICMISFITLLNLLQEMSLLYLATEFYQVVLLICDL